MEPIEKTNDHKKSTDAYCGTPRKGRSYFGLLLVVVGVVWLLRRTDIIEIPDWVFTWPMFLIAAGVFHGIRHRFTDAFSYILILIGSVFLAKREFGFPVDFEIYLWPTVLIVVGLMIFFKPRRKRSSWKSKSWNHYNKHHKFEDAKFDNSDSADTDTDRIDSVAVFSGVQKEVTSINFKGGDIVAVFGGAEINLMQADFQGKIELHITAVFGGVSLLVPPHWDVRINTVNIAGGVEDKRKVQPTNDGNEKLLILTGNVMFGGLEIKAY